MLPRCKEVTLLGLYIISQTPCLPESVNKNYLTAYGKIIVFRISFFLQDTADIKPVVSLLLKQNKAIMERIDQIEELAANQQTFAVKPGEKR